MQATLKKYEDELKIKNNALDMGCGAGENTIYLQSLGLSVVAVDAVLPRLMPHYDNVIWLESEISELDFSNRYDVILAIDILQFLNMKKRRKVMNKITNHLNPKGILFVKSLVQKNTNDRKYKTGIFTENELKKWAIENCFNIREYKEEYSHNNRGSVILVSTKIN